MRWFRCIAWLSMTRMCLRTSCTAFSLIASARDRGYLGVYLQAVRLLDRVAGRVDRENRPSFVELDAAGQATVLARVLRRYQHPDNEETWRRRLGLTGRVLEQIAASPTRKRFRRFVVREFVEHYFAGRRGWEQVGYDSFPGSPAEELAQVELEDVEAIGRRVVLRLADGTYERLDRERFEELSHNGIPESVSVKDGRQKARLGARARDRWLKVAADSASGRILAGHGQPPPSEFDCVIVGSGPVGAAAAEVLVKRGLEVAMLESGSVPEQNRFEVMRRSTGNQVAWEFGAVGI